MAIHAKLRNRCGILVFCFAGSLLFLTSFSEIAAGQDILGSIIGRVRISRGDTPPERVLVYLNLHQTPVDSVYTDSQGTFGFHNLQPEAYEVSVNDEQYQPVRLSAVIHPGSLSPTVMVDIQLIPKNTSANSGTLRQPGSNPYSMDVHEYSTNIPKKAVKEFEKGVAADRDNKKDDAITHYRKAIEIAPDYYPAHNNLGTLYLGKSDFQSAEEEFRQAVRLDPNEAQAYFNLGNALMLTERYSEAETTLALGLQRRPDSAFGYFLQGCLYARNGKLGDAETSLQKAINLDPKMPQSYLQLVNVYLHENRRADAVTQLQAFLKGFPDDPAAPKAKEMLTKLQTQDAAKQ
jgi:Flp pilus assembly protein TadD